jgi:gamma-F420-2:alpha-L-glutamate ligase
MQGWLLNKLPHTALTPDSYGINRFLEESRQQNISLRIVCPRQIDILVADRGPIGEHLFLLDGKKVEPPDFVLNRMGSATTYFALAAMRQIENAGVYLPNSARSVEVARDKMHTLQVLAQNGLPIAKSMLAKFPTDVDLVERELGFPVIVKTLAGSQGRGVFLCENRQKFEDLLGMITTSKGNPNFVIQQFIAKSAGRDLRVFVIGGRVVGCMMRVAGEGTFKANYSRGAKVVAYPLNPLIERLALDAAQVLGLEIAGVDLLFDGQNFKVCEANSSPGFRGMEECCAVNVPAEILSYIVKRVDERRNNFSSLLQS